MDTIKIQATDQSYSNLRMGRTEDGDIAVMITHPTSSAFIAISVEDWNAIKAAI